MSASSRHPSNWGRWGPDDERGAANLLTPDKVRSACAKIGMGRVFELGIELRKDAPVGGERTSPQHFMTHDGGDFAALGRDDWGTADDYIMLPTQGTTHIDGLAHIWSGGRLYNDFSFKEVRSSGAARLGVEKLGGLVTTAHLFDCADRPEGARLAIGVADLEERFAQERPEPGDALLLHTGWMTAALAGETAGRDFPVLSVDAASWIADQDLAIVGADNIAVEATGRRGVLPPLHEILVRDLGVTLVELLRLDEPAAARVRSGLLVIAPLRISRGVGSPVNPLLIA